MTIISFPQSPYVGQQYTASNNIAYVWDGEKWESQASLFGAGTNYILPIATNSRLGGVQIGAGIDVDVNGVISIPLLNQSNWNETDATHIDYIKNKPTITNPVQSDWNETDSSQLDYIKNKPSVPQLPTNAVGYLYNNGSGTLSWSTPTGGTGGTTLPTDASGVLTNDGEGGLSWSTPWTTQGYLTSSDLSGYQVTGSYLTAEADTLDSVTTRGNTTTNNITVGDLTVSGEIKSTAGVGDVVIEANNGTLRTWTFGADGKLTFPTTVAAPVGQTTQAFGMGNLFAWQDGEHWTIATGNPATGAFGENSIAISPGIESSGFLYIPQDTYANVNPVQLANFATTGKVQIQANTHSWNFGADGSITFPDNTVQTTAWTGTILTSQISDYSPSTSTLVNGSYTVTLGSTGTLTLPATNKVTAANTPQVGYRIVVTDDVVGSSETDDPNEPGSTWMEFDASKTSFVNQIWNPYCVGAPDSIIGWTVTAADNTVSNILHANNSGPAYWIIVDQYAFGPSPYTFQSPDYVPASANDVHIEVGGHNWTFGQDGKLTFPDESQQSFAPSTGVGPLNPWGTPFPSGVGVAGTDYQFYFDISNSGRPSIQSYSPNGGYPLYNTIWNIQLYSAATVGNDSSGATPVQVNNTGGVNLCDPIGPGDCAIVRVQNLDTGRVYRATFLGSYNVADTGNETKYGSITVERLV